MDQGRLPAQRVTFGRDLVRHVPRHAKVRVLVDGTGNQTTRIVRLRTALLERYSKGRGKRRRGLDRREGALAHVRTPFEAEGRASCRVSNGLPDATDVRVHVAHVVAITKNEGLVYVEAARNNVLGVLARERSEAIEVVCALLLIIFPLPQELLVVGHLDH